MTPLSDSEAATVQRFENTEPAPESWGGGLRERVYREILLTEAVTANVASRLADAVLALPELAALRAKADAADRVRELHVPLDRGTGPQCQGCATHVTFIPWPCATIAALDGPSPC